MLRIIREPRALHVRSAVTPSFNTWGRQAECRNTLSGRTKCQQFCLFFKDFIYLFSERGEGREKERERNINVWLPLVRPLLGTRPTTQACALTGSGTGDPLVRRPALSPLSGTSQG